MKYLFLGTRGNGIAKGDRLTKEFKELNTKGDIDIIRVSDLKRLSYDNKEWLDVPVLISDLKKK